MKISLFVIGKTNFAFVKDGIAVYTKRLKRYVNFEMVELPDVKGAKNMSPDELKKREAEILEKKIKSGDFVVLLDEKGKEFNSREFASFIQNKSLQSTKHLIFIVGGAYGFSEQMYQRANSKISLSKMTFSHQIIRVIFMEQFYRAFTIINGEPYHND